jgi:putative SOS response-associated peptidase YedK
LFVAIQSSLLVSESSLSKIANISPISEDSVRNNAKAVVMCAEYQIRASQKRIEEALEQRLRNETDKKVWDQHVKLTMHVPVIESDGEGYKICERVFPANPFPNSRLSGVEPRSETGDEIEFKRIYDMPTWKQGFKTERCLAVATRFLEAVYWGEKPGTVQGFQIPDRDVFFIAAIGIKPNVPKTGRRDGVSLLTHTATEQMLKFHHRLLVLLKPEDALGYLEFDSESRPSEIFDYLIEKRFTGRLNVTEERKMAKGWNKRGPAQEIKLQREQHYVKALKAEGVEG